MFFSKIVPIHASNVTNHNLNSCSGLLKHAFQDRCNYVDSTRECQDAVHFVNYLKFIFCDVGNYGAYHYVGGFVLVAVLCLFLFTFLSTTSDKFYCPVLAVISKMLKMSENLAGVTLLAFGNGSPDIFSSISNYKGDTELMYTELLGAAAFVTGLIAGIVIIMKPYNINARNYARDVIFFLLAIVLIDHFMSDEGYTLWEGIATVMIYVAYLIYVFVDHFHMKRKIQQIKRLSASSVDQSVVDGLQKQADDLEETVEIQIKCRRDSSVILDEDIRKVFQQKLTGDPNDGLFKTFINGINPVNVEDWKESGCVMRTLLVLKAPVVFFLLMFVPIVDYNEKLHGWSKLLNMLHMITLPQLLLFLTGTIGMTFLTYFPLSLIVLLISLGVSFAVYRTSRNDCPPKYHELFAAGTFIGSICVIYSTAKEVVSVMKAIGYIFDISDSFVGLFFLAIGNSVGDLFSNFSLAKQGYHQMAFAACFGGPLFNSLLGVGITFIMKAMSAANKKAFVRQGALGPNCFFFLFCILVFTLISFGFTRFRANRLDGVNMIIIYTTFIVISLLGELEVIHPFGTDHSKTSLNKRSFHV